MGEELAAEKRGGIERDKTVATRTVRSQSSSELLLVNFCYFHSTADVVCFRIFFIESSVLVEEKKSLNLLVVFVFCVFLAASKEEERNEHDGRFQVFVVLVPTGRHVDGSSS